MTSPTVLLLIGVSGAGKTTVGRSVAEQLGWDFFDADDLHPPQNVTKMAAGEGLTDVDRAPWLAAVRRLIERRLAEEAPAVVACSALKTAYRRTLRAGDPRVALVWLDVPRADLELRLNTRAEHFAGAALLPSQLAALEPPSSEEAVRVQAMGDVSTTAQRVIADLGLDA